jgi:hypothetical protein
VNLPLASIVIGDRITTDLARKMVRSYDADAVLAIEEGNVLAAGHLAEQVLHWCGVYARLVAADLARTDLEMREADYAHGAA